MTPSIPKIPRSSSNCTTCDPCARAQTGLRGQAIAFLFCSIDFLHLGCLVCGTLNFFQRRQVVIIAEALVIVIDAEAELDHAVDAACELCRLVKAETRCEQGSV